MTAAHARDKFATGFIALMENTFPMDGRLYYSTVKHHILENCIFFNFQAFSEIIVYSFEL